jgi:hypothetical protein
VLVFDTSAYINGRHDHFFPKMFAPVWTLVEEAIDDGRIILPREVYRELRAKDDALAGWIKLRIAAVTEPSEEVQRRAGVFMQHFPKPGVRNGADPFILAEAEIRRFTVTTYEGRSFSGVPTKNWASSMPGICAHFEIPCCTLPEALERLGLSL